MTLSTCTAGTTLKIKAISVPKELGRRLQMLGMTKGTQITVLRKKRSGAMIIKLRGVRYAIGKNTADGIFVGEEKLDGKDGAIR